MSSPQSPSQQVIDQRFVLEREHRRGGMGTVFQARDLKAGERIALKLLHDTSAEQAARFVRESALLEGLAHPGIVRYVAHGVTAQGVPYLAMEWLEGETLAERLARGSLRVYEAIALIKASLRGLAVAHRRGIVHRDVKPSNLFLRGGRFDDVVVLDLGLARHAGSAHDVTQTGSIIGTPSYMAPEQAQGRREVTPALDVYSIGCVLYECLVGEPPFVGAHIVTVLAKVLFEPAPRLRARRPELSDELDGLLDRLVAKPPGSRPSDATALLAELERLGPLPDRESPASSSVPPRPSGLEQELVSVILATPDESAADAQKLEAADTVHADTPAELELPDVASYGGELKHLADGTLVVTLRQRNSAATDLAARAARCALRLQQARPGCSFVVATGRGALGEGSYVGDAVERAGIMLRARGPEALGSVWLDEVTSGLLDARFSTERSDSGIVAFVLKGEDPSSDAGRRLLGRPTTCVGRDHELGMLELALRACIDESSARAVLVVGPPGIGKSRLRHELLRQLAARGEEHTLLVGFGDPVRTKGTSGMLGSALLRFCQVRSDLDEAEQLALFMRRIAERLGDDAQRVIVFLAELCGLRGLRKLVEALHDLRHPDSVLHELRAASSNPLVMSDLITEAWLAFLRTETAARPVVLVLDDLQWSDALTITLVEASLRELADRRLLVLALGRPETQELYPELWAPRLTTLPLRPLGVAAAKRLVRQVLSEASDESVERIAARAGGNALYLEELIRAAEAKRDAVPETVVAMLQARIGLLPASERRLLRAASVFGESFARVAVEQLIGESPSDVLSPRDFEVSLTSLIKHEILEPEGDARGRHRFRFRHALMCDAAYGLMTPDDQRAAHAGAARYLESVDEDPAVIADHERRGGQLARAVGHYTLAADHAWQHRDFDGAAALVASGVACGAQGHELGVLRSIEATLHYHRYDFSACWNAMTEALQLLPLGDARRLQVLCSSTMAGLHLGKTAEVQARMAELLAAEPGEGQHGDYTRTLGHGATLCSALGQRAAAKHLLERTEQVDRAVGDRDPFTRAAATYYRARFEHLLGDDPCFAHQLLLRSVPGFQHIGDRRAVSVALAELGESRRRLFSLAEGEAAMRESVALASMIRDIEPNVFVAQYLSTLLAEHGSAAQLEEARAIAESTIAMCHDSAAYRALSEISLAHVARRGQAYEAALRHARCAYDVVHELGLLGFFPHVDATLIQVLVESGDTQGAAAVADVALGVVEQHGPMGIFELPLRLQAARAHLGSGRRDDAKRGLSDALAALRRRAEKIPDEAMRARFLDAVPENVALQALGRELDAAG